MSDLTKNEAYLAMFAFLTKFYSLTKSDDVAVLLGGMSFLNDGRTADPAAWNDWEEAVTKAKAGDVDARLILRK